MSEKKKKAGTYNLITGTGINKQISKMFQALCKDTNEIWHAKMIDNESIKTYNLQKHMDYNEEVLSNTRQKQNILYVKEIFEKNNNTFIIQELYDESLTERAMKEHPLPSEFIQAVLNDVVNGLIELYGERYYTRSLRPQHIVCVENVWKIQSFVLDSKIFPIESEIVWSGTFASPEDKYNNGRIDEEKVDEQMVWQVGMLGLYMLLGPRFEYQKILKDTDINWASIKNIASPELYQMLQKSLKTNYEERIKIRNFLQLPIFKDLDIDLIMSIFQSGSKFFDPKKLPSPQKKSGELNEEDKKIWIGLKEDIQRFRIFGQIDRYIQELTIKNQYDIALLKYLSFRLCFQNLKTIQEQAEKWVRFDTNVCSNSHLHSWIKDLKIKLNQIQKLKIRHLNVLRKNSPTISEIPIMKQFILNQEISDDTTPQSKVILMYWRMTGFIYTNLVKNIDKSEDLAELERTIGYYSICAAALLQNYKKQDFKEREKFQQGDVFSLREYIKEVDIEILRETSQNLIRKSFQTQSS